MCPKRVLVDLDVVAVSLLHGLGKLGPDDAILLGNGTEALSHAALHALQATHVDVGLVVLPGCFFLGLAPSSETSSPEPAEATSAPAATRRSLTLLTYWELNGKAEGMSPPKDS